MQKTSPKKLSFIVLIFALPILASWFLYHYHTHFDFKTVNHGVLLHSPIDVNYLYSQTTKNEPKKWHIIAMCDSPCAELNDQLTRVKKALGKDSDRLLVKVKNSHTPPLKKLQDTFIQQGNTHFQVSNKIFLVDPLGNLFMYYPNTVDPMHILKDLKRVLEVSQIG